VSYTGRGELVPKKEEEAEWDETGKKYKEEIISCFHNPKRLL
jgi:hypothetical protein